MKGKQLALLLVLGGALGAAWYYLPKDKQSAWSDSTAGGGKKVVDFPINDVMRVTIKSADGELNLVKKADLWTVQERADYPANFETVGNLLRKLWELKTVQEVKVGPSQLSRLDLDEKAATTVEFKGKDDKELAGLMLGKKFMRKMEGGGDGLHGAEGGFPAGRYVKPIDDAKVSLVSETLDEVQSKPESWLLKDFIKIESPKSVSITGEHTWSLNRENATAEWKLSDAKPEEKIDAGKTSSLNNVFAAPTFNDVLAPDAKLEDPVTTATIETFDGFHYELKIGKPNGDNYPVMVSATGNFPKERTPEKDEKPEDKTRLDGEFATKQKSREDKLANEKKVEGRAYLVPKYLVDPLLKDRAALLPDKPAEPAEPAQTPMPQEMETMTVPTKIEATTPPVTAPFVPTPAPTAPPEPPPAPDAAPTMPPEPSPAPPTPTAEPPAPATPAEPMPEAAPAAEPSPAPAAPSEPMPEAAPAAEPSPAPAEPSEPMPEATPPAEPSPTPDAPSEPMPEATPPVESSPAPAEPSEPTPEAAPNP